jgi:hypothetical protein
MKRAWWAVVLAAAMLAGCADDTTDDPGDLTGEHDDGTDDGDDAMDSTAENTAPLAVLSADNTTITVPADVTFTITGTDADGDDLAWTLDADGDGSADADGTLVAVDGGHANATFTTTFDTPGTYDATLTIEDAEANATAALTITAEEPLEEDDDGEPNATSEPELEDRGDYTYDPATGHCTVKPELIVTPGGVVYVVQGLSGTWIFVETNLVEGLQVALNHPGGAAFDPPVEDDCLDGDQVLL